MDDDSATTRYCLTCRYPLRGLTDTRCPECGRGFDPDDSDTTAASASRKLAFDRLYVLTYLLSLSSFLLVLSEARIRPIRFFLELINESAPLHLFATCLLAAIIPRSWALRYRFACMIPVVILIVLLGLDAVSYGYSPNHHSLLWHLLFGSAPLIDLFILVGLIAWAAVVTKRFLIELGGFWLYYSILPLSIWLGISFGLMDMLSYWADWGEMQAYWTYWFWTPVRW